MAVNEPTTHELSVYHGGEIQTTELVGQVRRIESAMKAVMKNGVHYGPVPGCGDKPVLFQPGAQKLALLFGFAPQYRVETTPLGNGHVSVSVVCSLVSRGSGQVIGEGLGICSTMEEKYRYRSERLDLPVPPAYWETRDPATLPPGCTVRKLGTRWVLMRLVERTNPADNYHTVQAMAAKRAFVSAIRMNTACSDMFSGSSVVEAADVPTEHEPSADEPATMQAPQAKPKASPAAPTAAPPAQIMTIGQLQEIPLGATGTIMAEVQSVAVKPYGAGKIRCEVMVADSTGSVLATLWGAQPGWMVKGAWATFAGIVVKDYKNTRQYATGEVAAAVAPETRPVPQGVTPDDAAEFL